MKPRFRDAKISFWNDTWICSNIHQNELARPQCCSAQAPGEGGSCMWGKRIALTLLCVVALCFQNCAPAFQQIDLEQKQTLLRKDSVFGGEASFIYLKSTALKTADEMEAGGSTVIPVQGPNGEVVITVIEPGTLGPGSRALVPVSAGHAIAQLEVPVAAMPTPMSAAIPAANNNQGFAILGFALAAVGVLTSYALIKGTSVSTPGAQGASYLSANNNRGSGNQRCPDGRTVTTAGSNNPCTDEAAEAKYHPSRCPSGHHCINTAQGLTDLTEVSRLQPCVGQDLTPGQQDGGCASPLLIAFNSNRNSFRRFELSNPFSDGRLFDILGLNARPRAHSKNRISWHNNENYMFITKPNAKGLVTGIDELFGNNTVGPDGLFSTNGYIALGKWDSNNDGYITREDPVYSELRLWSDRNFDAVANADELLPLTEMNVEVIDLNYDAGYIERDRYGNLTALKSAVKTTDGQLHLLFDLWFALQ